VVIVAQLWRGIALVAVLAVACSESSPAGDGAGGIAQSKDPLAAVEEGGLASAPAPSTHELPAIGPDVIKTAELDVEVARDGLGDAMSTATTVATRYQGFVVATSTRGSESRRGTMVLRVPADRFEEALNDLRGLGEVEGQEVLGEDVSEEFVDLEARLRHLQAQERVMLALFDEAVAVADTIRIQNELSGVQLQIEELRGRLRYLHDQTTLSTISVTLAEEGAAIPGALDRAWARALDGFLSVVAGLVVAIGYALPFSLLALVALLVLRKVRPSGAAGSA
jgi:hypothetical protein